MKEITYIFSLGKIRHFNCQSPMQYSVQSFDECSDVTAGFDQFTLFDDLICFYSTNSFLIYKNNQLELNGEVKNLRKCLFLSSDHLCCILDNGTLLIWSIELKSQFERTINSLHNSIVSLSNIHDNLLSILFIDNILVVIELKNIFAHLEPTHNDSRELKIKKWKFGTKINDLCPLKLSTTSCVSPTLYFRQPELYGNLYLCVGNTPTIGIYWCEMWKKRVTFADAYALVDSALSSARHLLGRSVSGESSTTKRSRTTTISPCELPLVQHFNDSQRTGMKICDISGRFALIKDNLGRFLLFDTKGCIVLRVWKGFRDSDGFLLTDKDGQLYCGILSRLRKIVVYWKLFDEEMLLLDCENVAIENLKQISNKSNVFFDSQSKKLVIFTIS